MVYDDREFHQITNRVHSLNDHRFEMDEIESVVVKVFRVSSEDVLQKSEGGSRRVFPNKWLFFAAKDRLVIASR